MQPFKWSKTNSVFIPEIDAEHKTIFRMARGAAAGPRRRARRRRNWNRDWKR